MLDGGELQGVTRKLAPSNQGGSALWHHTAHHGGGVCNSMVPMAPLTRDTLTNLANVGVEGATSIRIRSTSIYHVQQSSTSESRTYIHVHRSRHTIPNDLLRPRNDSTTAFSKMIAGLVEKDISTHNAHYVCEAKIDTAARTSSLSPSNERTSSASGMSHNLTSPKPSAS